MKLAQARHIDAILVTELSRWGRSTQDLLDTLNRLSGWRVSVVAMSGMTFEVDTPHEGAGNLAKWRFTRRCRRLSDSVRLDEQVRTANHPGALAGDRQPVQQRRKRDSLPVLSC